MAKAGRAAVRDLAPEELGRSFEEVAAENSAAVEEIESTDPAVYIPATARLLAIMISDARAAGYRVQMAFPIEALAGIAVSATAKVAE